VDLLRNSGSGSSDVQFQERNKSGQLEFANDGNEFGTQKAAKLGLNTGNDGEDDGKELSDADARGIQVKN
jgi:hypothetical protein